MVSWSLLLMSVMVLPLGSEDIHSADNMVGTFYFKSKENLEPYMKELGVDPVLRMLAMIASPIVTVAR